VIPCPSAATFCILHLLKTIFTADFLKFFIPLAGALIAWIVNEKRKRASEEYQRKEQRYQELLRTVKGFYIAAHDEQKKSEFVEQLKLCWLYCPDEVIKKAYAFLDAINPASQKTVGEKNLSLGDFVVALRKDLLSRKSTRKTKLTSQDYQHF